MPRVVHEAGRDVVAHVRGALNDQHGLHLQNQAGPERVGGLIHVQERVQAFLALHAGLLVNVQGVGPVALGESADQLSELRNVADLLTGTPRCRSTSSVFR
jgi:hypothetical protein